MDLVSFLCRILKLTTGLPSTTFSTRFQLFYVSTIYRFKSGRVWKGGFKVEQLPQPPLSPPVMPSSPFHCYVDDVVHVESHGAVRMVIVDGMGSIVFVMGSRYESMVNPYLVELQAFQDAIRWCGMHGIQGVEFLGDAQVVVDQICCDVTMNARGGDILQEINGWKQQMSDLAVRFIGRQSNRVVHLVAKKALSLCPIYWYFGV
ncbi:unnamed protein product [Linum trigynum]|uniref:RNase H type-1 domain-containing protein n=1 Tax=Linum trigynum TaxID=586398 RepID=A0AAV2EBG4_9ROSI